ncbi:hypothetical protein BTHERMOSOX_1739 [Bathymodiolus thermophilus thioautotrophic gill symbiont]|uniref:hypothetical protein n=1 Tax=Bathymodiolus thermophilus thioautotrophic gill symbiont TaxID=2360 RepID=UPI0010BC7D82|nr:hypothetical protein [Bathymodiolus thermophilus thioautotrophic gill symbiont]CAB5496903.1 hypothetical protein THERMOT_599 [Bathymodiolus thermophilus thioautotrophic gill symbiont]SGZ87657.1 hypothetical protein BTHERMOSOX_1739 [Bathymodiolus thermophilus thioautotrophic gill symbiont]
MNNLQESTSYLFGNFFNLILVLLGQGLKNLSTWQRLNFIDKGFLVFKNFL